MYDPILKNKQQWLQGLLPGSALGQQQPEVAPLPEPLLQWLVDLRLLRHLPFHYLVPEPGLLPPESVRFFHVDPTFTDRLVDGALAAGNIGTLDQGFSAYVMTAVRQQVDGALARLVEDGDGNDESIDWRKVTLTGMLLRSVVVRRWPQMEIRAYKNKEGDTNKDGKTKLATVRQERIGKGTMIALFAGRPLRVEVQEPNEGTRFGIEAIEVKGGTYSLQPRNDNDQQLPKKPVQLRGKASFRLLDLEQLATDIATLLNLDKDPKTKLKKPLKSQDIESSLLALGLQQPPYVQIFSGNGAPDTQFLEALTAHLAEALRTGGAQ